MSPPFTTWDRYYVIPADIITTLKALAFDISKDPSPMTTPRINLAPLLKDEQGEDMYVMETVKRGESTVLVPRGKLETVWSIKAGLIENDDFTFVSSHGWKSILDW